MIVARKPLHPRWWLESRETGEITVVQFPNWPLFAIVACAIAGLVAGEGSGIGGAVGLAAFGLWLYWGVLEMVRGVNPWRRVLGAGVILWQLSSLVG